MARMFSQFGVTFVCCVHILLYSTPAACDDLARIGPISDSPTDELEDEASLAQEFPSRFSSHRRGRLQRSRRSVRVSASESALESAVVAVDYGVVDCGDLNPPQPAVPDPEHPILVGNEDRYFHAPERTREQRQSTACLRQAVRQSDVDDHYFAAQDRLERAVAPRKPFAVILGANNGILADRLMPSVIGHKWEALLVEPSKDAFRRLRANLALAEREELWTENVALADLGKEGPVTLTLAEGENDGMAKIDASGEPQDERYRLSRKLQRVETVQGENLQRILGRHHVDCKDIDLLQVDLEGFDYSALQQFTCEPPIIFIEANEPEEKTAVGAWLREHSYDVHPVNDNFLAVHDDWLAVHQFA